MGAAGLHSELEVAGDGLFAKLRRFFGWLRYYFVSADCDCDLLAINSSPTSTTAVVLVTSRH